MAKTLDTNTGAAHGTYLSYTIGFVLSIILTLGAYYLVVEKILAGRELAAAIVGLAVLQLFVQLLFFLHLGSESKPRWNLMVFLFAALVVVIVVFGSIWIMDNLDYHMMPEEMDHQLLEQNKKGGF